MVARQLELLRMRNTVPVFCEEAAVTAQTEGSCLRITWQAAGQRAVLDADFSNSTFCVTISDSQTKKIIFE